MRNFALMLVLLTGCYSSSTTMVQENTERLASPTIIGELPDGRKLVKIEVRHSTDHLAGTHSVYLIQTDGKYVQTIAQPTTTVQGAGKRRRTIVVDGVEYIPAVTEE